MEAITVFEENLEDQREFDPEQARWNRLTLLEQDYERKLAGWTTAESSQPRRPRQSSEKIQALCSEVETHLAAIASAESEAGPSATVRIVEAKRFQAASGAGVERQNATRQMLGQRNGLARILLLKERADYIMNVSARVLDFLDVLMDLSANAAVLSGSSWKSTETWLARNFPVVYDDVHPLAKEMFESKRAASAIAIAGRVVVTRSDLRTAPSVTAIAHRFEIVAHELRVGRARSGLTSIDRKEPKARWKDRSKAQRRLNGSRAQSEMTTRAEDVRLAALAGCTDRTIRAHRLKGDLPTYLAGKGVSFPHSSPHKDYYEETSLGNPVDEHDAGAGKGGKAMPSKVLPDIGVAHVTTHRTEIETHGSATRLVRGPEAHPSASPLSVSEASGDSDGP